MRSETRGMQAGMMQVTTVAPHSAMPLRCSEEAVDLARMCDQGSSLLAMSSEPGVAHQQFAQAKHGPKIRTCGSSCSFTSGVAKVARVLALVQEGHMRCAAPTVGFPSTSTRCGSNNMPCNCDIVTVCRRAWRHSAARFRQGAVRRQPTDAGCGHASQGRRQPTTTGWRCIR